MQNIVCTYWLNVVGAAAPTASMVPATMNMFKFACYRRTYSMVIVHIERRLHFKIQKSVSPTVHSGFQSGTECCWFSLIRYLLLLALLMIV